MVSSKTIPRLVPSIIFLALIACQPQEPQSSGLEPTAPAVADTVADASNDIVLGHIDTLSSSILEEDRDLWIYLPRSVTDDNPDNDLEQYPVVYLLDGNGHFRSVAGMLYQLSTVNGNMVLPEMMIVGLPNTDRMRDLTPTHTDGTTGGGTAFLDFIENEAIPYVEENYPASAYRTFIGHSLGGLMAIEALIERTELFDNYVAIDPSLWWDEQAILRKGLGALNEMNFSGKSLFVSVANTMRPGMTYDRVRDDTSDQTTHIRSILEFSETAQANTSSGLNFAWQYYGDDSHGSVPLISEYDALRFIFDWHDPNRQMLGYMAPDSADDSAAITEFVNGHFAAISAEFGYTQLPPLNWTNSFAVAMRSSEKPNIALALTRLNLGNYPQSATTHETMADYYLWQDDEAAARTHFQHAIDRGADIDIDARIAASQEEDDD